MHPSALGTDTDSGTRCGSGHRRRLAGAGLALALALAASACGFQLRGSTQLPYRTLHAIAPATGAQTVAELRRMLRISGDTRLVDRPQDAEAVLTILSVLREKEIVGFSSTGRPREYQLRLRVAFRLAEKDETERIPYTEIVLRRDITTTDTQLVAKEQEETMLYRDMQDDAVQQLIRRIAALAR